MVYNFLKIQKDALRNLILYIFMFFFYKKNTLFGFESDNTVKGNKAFFSRDLYYTYKTWILKLLTKLEHTCVLFCLQKEHTYVSVFMRLVVYDFILSTL